MYPFIHIGSLEFPSYLTLIITGYVLGMLLLVPIMKIYDFKLSYLFHITILSGIGLIIGAKILYFISVIPELVGNWNIVKLYPLESMQYAFDGYVFYGGLIGILLMLMLFSFIFEVPFYITTNIVIPIIPFVHIFGRIGCFLAGCCYGIKYTGAFHITFPEDSIIEGLAGTIRFPVQLFEAILNFALFIFLTIYTIKKKEKADILSIYIISYTIMRFFLEFLRGDIHRGKIIGLSTSQWISLLLLLIGIYYVNKRKTKLPHQE